jgi:hypothetical protein
MGRSRTGLSLVWNIGLSGRLDAPSAGNRMGTSAHFSEPECIGLGGSGRIVRKANEFGLL